MASPINKLLVVGAALSGLAALMHLACLVLGAPLFRLLGAGEQMAQLHSAGHWYPTVVTLVIAGVLTAWSAYALSGAGVIRRLPLPRTVLSAITAIYIIRGVAFVPVMAYFPGNSVTFWVVSSSICLLIGMSTLWVFGNRGAGCLAARPNNAFKPKPLRYAKHMAGTACHVLCSTTRLGLT